MLTDDARVGLGEIAVQTATLLDWPALGTCYVAVRLAVVSPTSF